MPRPILSRVFTLDTRKDVFPAYNSPHFHQFAVDPYSDSIIVLLGNSLGQFSISAFPEYTDSSVNAVYVNAIAVDPASGLLAVGGDDYSGSPPLKVFDLRQRKPKWVTTNLSDEFINRSPSMAARLEGQYGPNLVSSPIRSVYSLAFDVPGNAILATTDDDIPRGQIARHERTLKKFSFDGELLCEVGGFRIGDIVPYPHHRSLAVSTGRDIVVLDANSLSELSSSSVCAARIVGMAAIEDSCLIVVSEEGEICVVSHKLEVIASSRINAIPRCIRFDAKCGWSYIGTNLGDILVVDRSAAVIDHARVSESVRDVALIHEGNHIVVGCKNMDFHVFSVQNEVADSARYAAWEERLSKTPTSVYTTTASLTDARIFISYSSADRAFAERLETRLTAEGIQCWRDSHSLKSGRITTQIHRAILKNDVLIVILSEASLASDWVLWEIERARTVEKEKKRDVICPISIDRAWQEWSDDPLLRREIRKYHIVPFSGWEHDKIFDNAYNSLVAGLRDNYLASTDIE